MTDEVYATSKVLTMDQAIDHCLGSKYSSYNLLQAILHVIVDKLSLEGNIFVLDSDKKKTSGETITKYFDQPEVYEQVKGGAKKLIKLKSLEPPDHRFQTFRKAQFVPENIGSDPNDERLAYLETMVSKITRILTKLTNHNEILTRNSTKAGIDKTLLPRVSLSMSTEPKISNLIDEEKGTNTRLMFTDDITLNPRKIIKKEFERIRNEFRMDFCSLTKKVMRMNDVIEEHKSAVDKINLVNKILDGVAPKDYVKCLNDKIECLSMHVSKIKKDIGKINSKIEDIAECSKYSDKRIKEIQERIKLLDKIKEILDRFDRFDEWKKKIHEELERFTEITEYLKIIKADKEELDYLFDEKADRDELLKLVTLEFFKSVQDDLSSGIVQVLEQLMRDEIEWERAHKEIQLMIDAKADHCEVTSLKKYINCKLEIIQKKLNDIIRNRLTAHAAAVKIRLLKDARCITCTAEADLNQLKYPVPIFGHVTYREAKCLCEPRNRYCGGSHTLVGPDQRLIRKQKMPLKSNAATTANFIMSEGTDGKLYRTRQQKCICTALERKEEQEEKLQKKQLFPC